MKIKNIEPWNNSRIVRFNVSCFDREMIIVFKDFNNFDMKDITNILCEHYSNWCDDDKGYCCEEYILENIPEDYKNNIVCVIYEDEGDDEDND